MTNLNLPQNLIDLSNISKDKYPVDKWHGAVNMIIVDNHIVYIKRSDTMPSHSGQIGLFGGHKNSNELDPIVTAMREFEEETAIDSSFLSYKGLLSPVRASKSRVIIPALSTFNGSIKEFSDMAVSNGEWSNLVFAPITELQNPVNWQYAHSFYENELLKIFFMPLLKHSCTYLSEVEETYLLWGVTAKMTVASTGILKNWAY